MTKQPGTSVEEAKWLAFDRTIGKVRRGFVGLPTETLQAVLVEAVVIARGRSE